MESTVTNIEAKKIERKPSQYYFKCTVKPHNGGLTDKNFGNSGTNWVQP